MKTWGVLALFLFSMPLVAKASPLDAFVNSDVLKTTIEAIEKEQRVTCDSGKASKSFPWFLKKVHYSAQCGTTKIKISAKYKNKRNPVFSLTTVKVWDKNILAFNNSSEEFFSMTSDPFLKAYKNSQLVGDVRRFVEREYNVLCKEGRVRKGRVGGKANYFYFSTCKSDSKKIKIKLKSKVRVFGDRFKFDLTKYKLTF